MPRILLLLTCLLLTVTGCGSAETSVPQPPATPQTIRFDGLYRFVEDRGTTEKGEAIYKLLFLRFLNDGTVHVATSAGIFDVEEKTREVAMEGRLSDTELNNKNSQGTWVLDVNKLEFTLRWMSRGRWGEHDGKKAFEFDETGEAVEFAEVHSGTVDGETLTMSFENEAFGSYGEYKATFVPVLFSVGE